VGQRGVAARISLRSSCALFNEARGGGEVRLKLPAARRLLSSTGALRACRTLLSGGSFLARSYLLSLCGLLSGGSFLARSYLLSLCGLLSGGAFLSRAGVLARRGLLSRGGLLSRPGVSRYAGCTGTRLCAHRWIDA
jgi:hypothetical protein